MRPLRLLQLSNRNLAYGGEEAVLGRITEALTGPCQITPFETESAALRNNPLTLPARALQDPQIRRALLAAHRRGSFDAWQAHTLLPGMSVAPYELAFQLGVPLIQFLHNYRFSCSNGSFLAHGEACQRCIHGNFFHALRTACWRNSHLASGWMGVILTRLRSLGAFENITRWIALSQTARTLHVEMGVPPDRIEVVPHFFDPGTLLPLPPPKTPTALFLGRLSPEKGVFELLRAWQSLGRSDARLLIAGDGPERARLEAFAQTARLENVQFLGFVSAEHQATLWEKAAFLTVPSIWQEPFGLVVLEAWARGRPVIAHRIGALQEVIRPGTGLLADPTSIEDLAGQMARAFDNPNEMESMGRAGHARLLSEFNKALWLERMLGVYRRAGLRGA